MNNEESFTEMRYQTAETVTISGNGNRIYIQQKVSFQDVKLETFLERMKWLFTGKISLKVGKE